MTRMAPPPLTHAAKSCGRPRRPVQQHRDRLGPWRRGQGPVLVRLRAAGHISGCGSAGFVARDGMSSMRPRQPEEFLQRRVVGLKARLPVRTAIDGLPQLVAENTCKWSFAWCPLRAHRGSNCSATITVVVECLHGSKKRPRQTIEKEHIGRDGKVEDTGPPGRVPSSKVDGHEVAPRPHTVQFGGAHGTAQHRRLTVRKQHARSTEMPAEDAEGAQTTTKFQHQTLLHQRPVCEERTASCSRGWLPELESGHILTPVP
mmetsp:Transcript_79049/g.249852  ORF Transcript_79049/g.249852 Transcript_79049/m.249852 type:complete len:259 (-) Transcript_79049:145-921(-)